MTIAYLRVSTEKQHLENQKETIRKFALNEKLTIDRWYTETVSGTTSRFDRSLGSTLRKLRKNDILIVSEVSRLSRKMLEIMTILNLCIEKGITLYSIKEGFRFADNMNSKIMGFAFGMSAEIERSLISARTKEALAYRKSQGVILGRPVGSSTKMNLLNENIEVIKTLLVNNTPIINVAKEFNVSRGTLYSFLKSKSDILEIM